MRDVYTYEYAGKLFISSGDIDDNMVAFLVNIQPLYPKLDTIMHHMQVRDIDMAFITETWINKNNIIISQKTE